MNTRIEQLENELRAIWSRQGVPKDKQDAILTNIAARAAPGAMVGPFQIPTKCKHNRMVSTGNPDLAWKCADYGYTYGG